MSWDGGMGGKPENAKMSVKDGATPKGNTEKTRAAPEKTTPVIRARSAAFRLLNNLIFDLTVGSTARPPSPSWRGHTQLSVLGLTMLHGSNTNFSPSNPLWVWWKPNGQGEGTELSHWEQLYVSSTALNIYQFYSLLLIPEHGPKKAEILYLPIYPKHLSHCLEQGSPW